MRPRSASSMRMPPAIARLANPTHDGLMAPVSSSSISTTISSARVRCSTIHTFSGDSRARLVLVRDDGKHVVKAGYLEDLLDRRLQSEYGEAAIGRLGAFRGRQNAAQARGRDIGNGAHVQDEPRGA